MTFIATSLQRNRVDNFRSNTTAATGLTVFLDISMQKNKSRRPGRERLSLAVVRMSPALSQQAYRGFGVPKSRNNSSALAVRRCDPYLRAARRGKFKPTGK